MRMVFPGLRERRTIDRELTVFFRDHGQSHFRRAVGTLSRFYRLPCPRILWFEYLDWGRTAGRTYENGIIHLVHPENWKRGRKYNSERRWVHTVYHEFAHYVLWADAERKADRFAYRFVRGVSGNGRNGHAAAPPAAAASRAHRKGGVSRSRPRPRPLRSRSR